MVSKDLGQSLSASSAVSSLIDLLLAGECSPTTDEVGFIELPVGDASGLVIKRWKAEMPIRVTHHTGALRSLLDKLLPLTSHQHVRNLFVQTTSRWTAYFSNGWRGTDSFAMISTLAEGRCTGIKAAVDQHPYAGGVIWDVYGPKPTDWLNCVRSISATQESPHRWEFRQSGEPFVFEEVGRYSARRIRDRFPPELLLEYLRHFDIDLFNAYFYCGPAVLIEIKTPNHPDTNEYASFEAARLNRPG